MGNQHAAQQRTLANATRRGATWTLAELEVIEAANARDEEIALSLDRTLYAVWTRRRDLRNGRTAAPVRPARRRELPYDRGFTTIPDEW